LTSSLPVQGIEDYKNGHFWTRLKEPSQRDRLGNRCCRRGCDCPAIGLRGGSTYGLQSVPPDPITLHLLCYACCIITSNSCSIKQLDWSFHGDLTSRVVHPIVNSADRDETFGVEDITCKNTKPVTLFRPVEPGVFFRYCSISPSKQQNSKSIMQDCTNSS
jgi:hypothetical protein